MLWQGWSWLMLIVFYYCMKLRKNELMSHAGFMLQKCLFFPWNLEEVWHQKSSFKLSKIHSFFNHNPRYLINSPKVSPLKAAFVPHKKTTLKMEIIRQTVDVNEVGKREKKKFYFMCFWKLLSCCNDSLSMSIKIFKVSRLQLKKSIFLFFLFFLTHSKLCHSVRSLQSRKNFINSTVVRNMTTTTLGRWMNDEDDYGATESIN